MGDEESEALKTKARRLLESCDVRRLPTSIGALAMGVQSLLDGELMCPRAQTSRDWTRFKRANLRDLRRSFAMSEHKEVKETPESKGSSTFRLEMSTTGVAADEEE